MNETSRKRFRLTIAVSMWLGVAGVVFVPIIAWAQAAGLVVAIANSYDGFLPASLRDANAIADKLEDSGFDAVRLLNATGGEMAAGIGRLRRMAEGAGATRLVYVSGFGMCINEDLVIFAEDLQPEQFKSGQVGDVAVPMSVLAEAVAAGATQSLVVFDTNPRRCTSDAVEAVKLPEHTVLLVTTGIGGDVIDEIDEAGMSAFATAFVERYAPDRPLPEIVSQVVAGIRELTDGQQQPILVGTFEQEQEAVEQAN